MESQEKPFFDPAQELFEPGRSYQFGAISRADVQNGNFQLPVYAAKKYPETRYGSYFIERGWRTVADFIRANRDETGKPYPATQTFVLHRINTDGTTEYLTHWQFSPVKPAEAESVADARKNYRRRADEKIGAQQNHANVTALGDTLNMISENSQRIIDDLRERLDAVTKETGKELDNVRRERSNLKIENEVLVARKNELEREVSLLRDERQNYKTILDEQFRGEKASWEANNAMVKKLEEERAELEIKERIRQAVEKARVEWEKEAEEEEETLRDDLRDELERDLEKKREKLKKEIEEFEKKQGFLEKGQALLGGLMEKPGGAALAEQLVLSGAQFAQALLERGKSFLTGTPPPAPVAPPAVPPAYYSPPNGYAPPQAPHAQQTNEIEPNADDDFVETVES